MPIAAHQAELRPPYFEDKQMSKYQVEVQTSGGTVKSAEYDDKSLADHLAANANESGDKATVVEVKK